MVKRMKIAIIIRRLNIKGGTQRLAVYLTEELQKKGHSVKFYTLFYEPEKSYTDFLKKQDVTFVDFRQFQRRAPLAIFQPLWQFLSENRAASALAERIDPDTDLLNPHDQVAYRVTRYFRRRRNSHVPSIWNMNDPPSLIWAYERERANDAASLQPWWKRLAYRLYDRYDSRMFISEQDAIVCQDRRNTEWLARYYGPEFKRKAVTCRNGPAVEFFTYRERQPLSRRIRLLSSGILFSHRRYEDAISAVKILLDWGFDPTLEIIGEYGGNPGYYEKLSALCRKLDLDRRVNFLGAVPEDELVKHYHENDIFLFQHHWQTDGLSPTEAMACGMAVVVSRTAGASEFIREGETGLVINPKSPQALAGAVCALVENPALYLTLSRDGARWVRKNLSPEIQARQIFAVYQQALTGR